jgi:hypothetical protein
MFCASIMQPCECTCADAATLGNTPLAPSRQWQVPQARYNPDRVELVLINYDADVVVWKEQHALCPIEHCFCSLYSCGKQSTAEADFCPSAHALVTPRCLWIERNTFGLQQRVGGLVHDRCGNLSRQEICE